MVGTGSPLTSLGVKGVSVKGGRQRVTMQRQSDDDLEVVMMVVRSGQALAFVGRFEKLRNVLRRRTT